MHNNILWGTEHGSLKTPNCGECARQCEKSGQWLFTPECSYWYWGMNSNRLPALPIEKKMGRKRKLPTDTSALPLQEQLEMWKEQVERSYVEGKWTPKAKGAYFVILDGIEVAFSLRAYADVVVVCERYLHEFPHVRSRILDSAEVRKLLGESLILLGRDEEGVTELRSVLKAYNTKPTIQPILGATILFRSLFFASWNRQAEDKVEHCELDLAAEVSVKGRPPGLPPLNFDSVENYGQLRDLLSH